METFKFEKESDNKWYVVLPEWEGEHWELEMVMGADTMLDILAQGESEVYASLSLEPIDNAICLEERFRHENHKRGAVMKAEALSKVDYSLNKTLDKINNLNK